MGELEAARRDLRACAALVGRPLTDWQARALELEARTTVVVAPRQSGKSRSLSVLALWRAFREREHRVLVVSAGEEAARRLLAEVRRIAVDSPLLAGSVVDDHAALIRLSNGAEVRSVPASARQIRGWTVDTLLIDEAALVPDELVLDAALPTTAARLDARVVLASSATTAAGAFYDFAIRGEAGSEHIRTFRWALGDAEWIAPSVIEAARESMSDVRFAAEYLGQFASGADALFSRAALDRVTADYLPDGLERMVGPARVLGGVDWGATVDRSALVATGRIAGAERRYGVRCVKRWPAGAPLAGVIEDIASSPAHFDSVAMETNGLGMPCAQALTERLRRRPLEAGGGTRGGSVVVDAHDLDRWMERQAYARRAGRHPPTRKVPIHTTADLKAATYSALRLLIDEGRLVLPAAEAELIRELLLLRVDLTPGGVERIEASAGHDDLADALMLAAVPYRDRAGRWRSTLGDLADPRRPLPGPALAPGVDLRSQEATVTAGGLEVPRRPVWQSVRGAEVTVPAGLELTARPRDPRLASARAAIRAALNDDPDGKEAAGAANE